METKELPFAVDMPSVGEGNRNAEFARLLGYVAERLLRVRTEHVRSIPISCVDMAAAAECRDFAGSANQAVSWMLTVHGERLEQELVSRGFKLVWRDVSRETGRLIADWRHLGNCPLVEIHWRCPDDDDDEE